MSLDIYIETFEGEPFTLTLETFSVGDAESNYTMTFSGYSQSSDRVTTPPFTNQSNGMMFTTQDRDNDLCGNNCASDNYRGGWWYDCCGSISLNGNYEGDVTPTYTGILVHDIDTTSGSGFSHSKAIEAVEMIIRNHVE